VEAVMMQLGSKVFIGHGGRSKEYLRLGVWLTDEGLEWEVFDRKPTAGLSTKERLSEMLDNAQIAFLLMTAEDETAEGKVRARENVVHEVGPCCWPNAPAAPGSTTSTRSPTIPAWRSPSA
jgi:predicted nucleotide-binding protein